MIFRSVKLFMAKFISVSSTKCAMSYRDISNGSMPYDDVSIRRIVSRVACVSLLCVMSIIAISFGICSLPNIR